MMTQGEREREEARMRGYEAAQEAATEEVNALPETDQTAEPIDLTGGQDMPGKKIADAIDEEVLSSQYLGDQDEGLPPELEMPGEEEALNVEEMPITHVKNMETKQVFEATPVLMKRRDLMTCDIDGKLVPDHRRFN